MGARGGGGSRGGRAGGGLTTFERQDYDRFIANGATPDQAWNLATAHSSKSLRARVKSGALYGNVL